MKAKARPQPAAPTWRALAGTGDAERTFVACRCGVDMEFDWPPSRAGVLCFGCGARFSRPGHLPPPLAPCTWTLPAPEDATFLLDDDPPRRAPLRARLVVAGLCVVLVGLALAGLSLL